MPQAGWYDDGSGRQRWWDGTQWTDKYDGESQGVSEAPVLTFVSQVEGADSVVTVYSDRMEWAKKSGGVSAGKITAGLLTAGLSLAATGVGKGSYTGKKTTDLSILHLDAVTSITSVKAGKRVVLTVSTPSMTLSLGLPKKDAEQVAQTLNRLVSAAKTPVQAQAVTVEVAAPTPQASPAVMSADPIAQIQNLAELHKQGILSDDEFSAAKAKLLGLA